MSWARKDGSRCDTPRNDGRGWQTKARARAMAMAAMRDQGWSLREIGRFFKEHHWAVKRIIDKIPPEARKLHESTRLVG